MDSNKWPDTIDKIQKTTEDAFNSQKERIEILVKENDALQMNLRKSSDDFNELQKKIEALEDKCLSVTNKYVSTREELRSTKSELIATRSKHDRVSAELEEDGKYRTTCEELERLLQKKEEEIKMLVEKMGQNIDNTLDNCDEENNMSVELVPQPPQAVEELDSQRRTYLIEMQTKLQESIKNHEIINQNLNNMKEEIDQKNIIIQESEIKFKHLSESFQSVLEMCETFRVTTEQQKASISKYEPQIKRLEEENVKLQESLEKVNKEINNHIVQVEILVKEKEIESKKNSDLKASYQSLMNEKKNLSSTFESLLEMTDTFRVTIENHAATIDDQKQTISILNEEKEELESSLREFRNSMERKDAEILRHVKKTETHAEEKEDFQRKHADLKNSHKSLQEELEDLISTKNEEIILLKNQVERLSETVRKVTTLEEQLIKTEESYEKLLEQERIMMSEAHQKHEAFIEEMTGENDALVTQLHTENEALIKEHRLQADTIEELQDEVKSLEETLVKSEDMIKRFLENEEILELALNKTKEHDDGVVDKNMILEGSIKCIRERVLSLEQEKKLLNMENNKLKRKTKRFKKKINSHGAFYKMIKFRHRNNVQPRDTKNEKWKKISVPLKRAPYPVPMSAVGGSGWTL